MKHIQHSTFFDIRTDLAIEETEQKKQDNDLPGVDLEESVDHRSHLHLTRVKVRDLHGARALNKPMGTYITLDASAMDQNDGGIHREISQALARQLRHLIDPLLSDIDPSVPPCILAVGLGNDHITPDALGPRVLDNLMINRHLQTKAFHPSDFPADPVALCGIIPGVMAQTGMETAEIVCALTARLRPHLVLVIDALAARSVSRLGTTIQLTDTGIHPGSGVGNHRHSLTKETLGVPVIAIGVPTVVSAAAIAADTMDSLIAALHRESDAYCFAHTLHAMSSDERFHLVRELLEPRFGPMFVTPKDIDETVKRLSFTVSEGINIALFETQR